MRPGPYAAAAAAAATAAAGSARVLRRWPPGGAARWRRTNFAGSSVSLLEGPALIAGATLTAGAGALAGVDPAPVAVVALGAGAAGVLDDLAGDATSKGLAGHLRALSRGRVTTGAVKIAVLVASGVLAADRLRAGHPAGSGRVGSARVGSARVGSALLGGAVIAGSANLANLLDLRPGRALKAGLIAGAALGIPTRRSLPAAVATGVALGLIRDDLAGRTMLGDGGANPLGGLLGCAVVAQLSPRGQVIALLGLTGLTLASERVSFSQVIASTPVLREIDRWGRA